MSNTDGLGDAGDAEIRAIPADVDPDLEERLAAGREEARKTYLEEAEFNVAQAQRKLEKAQRELADAEANVEATKQALADLGGGN